ncbi:hypothetical protein HMPREF9194_00723 [Treponema maltophilum ATCC 51939]|uniref:PD-(D/E)XK endonuclease-like domain-containing protein n=1 Tax=Treponema maltophilum ATCC 51939 TaxID=1125699 RepID=S3K0I6_TREMA|nr:PD-(D/E)XK nuclease family protein [Treponema maltophilum]EPF30406.1 hypothetical protein HMPREF9194_00723 [Treponema maltophilum ATCC 51939]
MQTVQSALEAYIDDPAVFFVFPTDIAASAWSDYALRLKKAVALERFTAWDKFKSEAVRAEKQDKNSIPSPLRKLFVLQLLRQNAEKPFFLSLVPGEYASNPAVFADWLTSLVPCLALWKRKRSERRGLADAERSGDAEGRGDAGILSDVGIFNDVGILSDAEDADLHELEKHYRSFLDSHNLFEPAWEKPPLKDSGRRYVIVYPEILQDFEEYRPILEQSPFIELIPVPDFPVDDSVCDFYSYPNARTELRETVLRIEELCSNRTKNQNPQNQNAGAAELLDWDDIAVSVPDLETLAPYILREFGLRNIPVKLRSGKKLGLYPAGRLFALIKNCADESFSFDSLRSLLSENAFPWKDKTAANQLIEFGIKNNCLCSYGGIDVWEEAFAKNGGEERALALYRKLKQAVSSMRGAPNFQKLRERYFAFRSVFFDPQKFSAEANLVIGRCIGELASLIDIEQTYPDAAQCADPFDFFVRVLDSKEYLAQSSGGGVNVFSYKVAAGAPFKRHFILNASQDSLTLVYRPLSFLSDEKRAHLGANDTDVSALFVRLYALHSEYPMSVSCSEKTFSGYTIAHNIFSSCTNRVASEISGALGADSFENEKNFLHGRAPFPAFLYSVQKNGFLSWAVSGDSKLEPVSCSLSEAAALSVPELKKRIDAYVRCAQTGAIRVSPSNLNVFFTCPLQWLFSRVLKIAEYDPEASLVDDLSVGTLFHEIIRRVLSQLQSERIPLYAENGSLPEKLCEAVLSFTHEVIASLPESCSLQKKLSPLTIENFKMQEDALAEVLIAFFTEFVLWFSGYTVVSLEEPLSFDCGGRQLEGKIDCVLQKAEGGDIFIVDFKTGNMPSASECLKLPGTEFKNYQLAAYMYLYEKCKCGGKPWVSGAGFFSIYQKKPSTVVGFLTFALDEKKTNPYRKANIIERNFIGEDGVSPVGQTFALLEEAANVYARELGDPKLSLFTDPERLYRLPDGQRVPYKTCAACRYKTLCRTVYSLGRQR